MRLFPLIYAGLLLLLAGCDKTESYTAVGVETFPPVPVEYAALYRMDALPVAPAFFREQWTWVGFGPANCLGACASRLQLLASVSGAQSLYVVNELTDHVRLRELAAAFPKVAIAMGTTAVSYDLFAAQFAPLTNTQQRETNLYLVAPGAGIVYSVAAADIDAQALMQEFEYARSQQ